jgi:hypothetical protein
MDLPPESSSAKDPTPQTTTDPARAAALFEQSVAIMARLRAPGGCPWDREQSFDSIRKYTLEEAYEVFDAIERRDFPHLAEELGDLLLAGAVLCGDGRQRRPLHHRRCARPSESQADSPPSPRLWRRGFARRRQQAPTWTMRWRARQPPSAQLGRDQSRGESRQAHRRVTATLRRGGPVRTDRRRGSTVFFARCPRWLKLPSSAPRRRNPDSTGRSWRELLPKSAEETAELRPKPLRRSGAQASRRG